MWEAPVAGQEEVAEAVAAADAAQRGWRLAPADERRRRFDALLELLLDRADEIASTVTAETGKPLAESYSAELFVAAESARWIARNAERVLSGERLRTPRLIAYKRARVVNEPLGAVAVISPWNFPFALPFTQVAAVVGMGNAAVLKPSELTPLSGELVAQLFRDAGFPPDLVSVVHGAGETGQALVEADGVAKILFTGSAEAGRAVASAAAPLLRPVTLELGGKDPMLVFRDCDLERALAGALWGSFTNCGQVCSGAERIYVERPLYKRFTEELAARASNLRVGQGNDPGVDLGPLITEAQRDRIEELVDDARANGADRSHRRRPAGGRAARMVLRADGARPASAWRAASPRRSCSGRWSPIEPFAGEEEAVRLANASPYGLGCERLDAGSRRALARISAALDVGSVWTNDISYSY